MLSTRTFSFTFIALCGLTLLTARPAQCSEIIGSSADADITSFSAAAKYNFGSEEYMVSYNYAGDKGHALLKFNLDDMKLYAVRSARLRLGCKGWAQMVFNPSTTSVFALAAPWVEQEVTWVTPYSGGIWRTAGGDIFPGGQANSAFAVNTQGVSIPAGADSYMEWDVTNLVRLWMSGKLPNNGLRISAADGFFSFESRESPYTHLRPALILDLGK